MKSREEDIMLESEGVELVFNPRTYDIQVGMGGEWWSGKVKAGNNVLSHRKEQIDEGYKPVIVSLKEIGFSTTEIRVSGGFGMEAVFKIGEEFPKNKFH